MDMGDLLASDRFDQIGWIHVATRAGDYQVGTGQSSQKNSHTDTSKLKGVFCRIRSSGVNP